MLPSDSGRRGFVAGVYGLSRAGHDRLGSFPAAIADDRLVDQLFAPSQTYLVGARGEVRVPRTAEDLFAVLVRTRRGTAEQSLDTGTLSLKELLSTIIGPRSAVDAACFVGFALAARYRTGRRRSMHLVPSGGGFGFEVPDDDAARASGAQAGERDDVPSHL
jgi:hypothetical protein